MMWLAFIGLLLSFIALWAILSYPWWLIVKRFLIDKGRAQGMEGLILVSLPSAVAFLASITIWTALLF